MHFSTHALFLSLLTTFAIASPLPTRTTTKRALQSQSYADFQISDGVAGNALAEVNAAFPVDTSDLASVSASDLSILQAARLVAEDAEVGTGGFDDELAATSGDTTALQNGKIKNKVLKLQLEVLGLMIQQAQGDDKTSEIATETTKLNTNVELDQAAAGQSSVGVTGTFSG